MRKYFTYLFLLATTSAFCQKNAQMFMAKNENSGINIITVNAMEGQSKFGEMPYLIACGVYCKNMDRYGAQPSYEAKRQDMLLKAMDRVITSQRPISYAGDITGNKKRLRYYYVKDTNGIRAKLQKLCITKGQKLICDIQNDPAGSIYTSLLSSAQAQKDWAYNMGLIRKLLQDGDRLTKPHKIRYRVYFRTDDGRSRFISHAKAKHYEVEKKEKQAQVVGYPYSVQLSQTSLIRPEIITYNTQELREQAANFEGRYDSWQTTVILDRKKKKSPVIARR